jgi:hypothetical protein
MYTTETKFVTLKQFAKYLSDLGIFAHIKNKNTIIIDVPTFDKVDNELDSVTTSFTADSLERIVEMFDEWITDESVWVDKNRIALFNPGALPYDFNLEEEILKLGFKYVEVEHEDANFVDVLVKYCYEDEDNNFRFDGELNYSAIGNKFETLVFLQGWIDSTENFRPTLNRMP